MAAPAWLSPLLILDGCGGWDALLEAAHQQYLNDFGYATPRFRGRPIMLRRTPVEKSKEAAFWHLISEGEKEEDRTPSISRCERLAWVRLMIESASDESRVRVWNAMRPTGRGPKQHWVIALPDFSYVVILRETGNGLLLLSAYPVERGHRRATFERQYLEWCRKNSGA